jgi:hypothetical protein
VLTLVHIQQLVLHKLVLELLLLLNGPVGQLQAQLLLMVQHLIQD